MSGCPLLIENKGKFQVVGLLNGCRPSLLHFYSARILDSQETDIRMIQLLKKTMLEKLSSMAPTLRLSSILNFISAD
jgi:hypothetical protein